MRQDIPSGPVVKTLLPLQGPGFDPWSGKFHIVCSADKKQNNTKIHTALRARDMCSLKTKT